MGVSAIFLSSDIWCLFQISKQPLTIKELLELTTNMSAATVTLKCVLRVTCNFRSHSFEPSTAGASTKELLWSRTTSKGRVHEKAVFSALCRTKSGFLVRMHVVQW